MDKYHKKESIKYKFKERKSLWKIIQKSINDGSKDNVCYIIIKI